MSVHCHTGGVGKKNGKTKALGTNPKVCDYDQYKEKETITGKHQKRGKKVDLALMA